MNSLLSFLASFLIGSIPVGFLLGKLKGVDVREVGSGNTGATNVGRVLGRQIGLLTLVLDTLKGVLAGMIGLHFTTVVTATTQLGRGEAAALCGLLAVIGHCFTPFLKFRGGKGVATSLGVFMVVCPVEAAVASLIFVLVLYYTKYVSLGSLVAAFSIPTLLTLFGDSGENDVIFIAAVAVALIVTFRHESNIKRLLKGRENRVYLFARHSR